MYALSEPLAVSIGVAVANVLLLPFAWGLTTILYFDLRTRQEGFGERSSSDLHTRVVGVERFAASSVDESVV